MECLFSNQHSALECIVMVRSLECEAVTFKIFWKKRVTNMRKKTILSSPLVWKRYTDFFQNINTNLHVFFSSEKYYTYEISTIDWYARKYWLQSLYSPSCRKIQCCLTEIYLISKIFLLKKIFVQDSLSIRVPILLSLK